jgi:hypothetical protein
MPLYLLQRLYSVNLIISGFSGMICRDFGWQSNRLANKPQGAITALDRIFKGAQKYN